MSKILVFLLSGILMMSATLTGFSQEEPQQQKELSQQSVCPCDSETITSAQYEELKVALFGANSTKATLTQRYCEKNAVNNTSCSNTACNQKHAGVDFGVSESNVDVFTPVSGKVISIRSCPQYSLSRVSIYNASRNTTHYFLHVENIAVSLNQEIAAGTKVATAASCGANSRHLHYEVRPGSSTASALCVSSTLNPYKATFPESNIAWNQVANLPVPLSGSAAAVYNGKIVVIGGSYLKAFYQFDPATQVSTSLPTPPGNGFDEAAAVVIGARLYVLNGIGNLPLNNFAFGYFDFATQTWRNAAYPLTKVRGPSCTVVNGKVYAIGGTDDNLNGLNIVQVYDPSVDRWTTLSTRMPTPRGFCALAVFGNEIFVAGGRGAGSPEIKDILEAMNVSTGTWRTVGYLPARRFGSSTFVLNSRLYMAAGSDGNQYVKTVLEYNPSNNAWRTLPTSLPFELFLAGGAMVNNKAYVIGGRLANDASTPSIQEGTPK